MAKVLVTGGAGYVGSHACKRLAQCGHVPIVFDNLFRGHAEFVKWGPFEEGDILEKARLLEVFKRHRPDAVMHFSALAYVGESMENPGLYYRNNVVGSLSLLQVMLESGISRMVFSSTCAIYGVPEDMPINENFPLKPINPYGRTKLAVENMLRDFDTAHALKSVSLRYFNAAGADADAEIGERHEPETHAIPLAVLAALGRIQGFKLFGNDYHTEDGTAVRDYVHVTDLASAHVLALEYLLEGRESMAANLGTGQGTSVRKIIESVERATGRTVPLEVAPRRPGDPPVLIADAERARSSLDWTPQFTTINEIVATAVHWHEQNGG